LGPLRSLTLRYFQPWTRPDQWKPVTIAPLEWAMTFS
jgi:hypothetical protein